MMNDPHMDTEAVAIHGIDVEQEIYMVMIMEFSNDGVSYSQKSITKYEALTDSVTIRIISP